MTLITDRPVQGAPTRDTARWQEKIYNGSWIDGHGVPIPVTEKATGGVLGAVGSATAEDLDVAVTAARAAQRDWAAAPYAERAGVLLRAAAILEAEPERLLPWLIREAGSAQGRRPPNSRSSSPSCARAPPPPPRRSASCCDR